MRVRLIAGFVAGVAVLAAGVKFRQPVARILIWATGNARGCGLWDCLEEIEPRIVDEARRIAAESTLAETDADGYDLHLTPAGVFWSPRGNALYFNLGEMSLQAYGGGKDWVRPGDVVLDCGANVGTFTREALRAGASKVVAFEIDPRNAECLRRNFREESAGGQVVVVAKGVWSGEGTVEVKLYTNTNLNTAVMESRPETHETPQVVRLPVTSIDRAVSELGLERVDFVKMDVEGAEVEALKGARKTLQRFRPRLSLVTENLPDDIARVPAAVKEIVPEYEFRPGRCRKIRRFMIRPEVVLGRVP